MALTRGAAGCAYFTPDTMAGWSGLQRRRRSTPPVPATASWRAAAWPGRRPRGRARSAAPARHLPLRQCRRRPDHDRARRHPGTSHAGARAPLSGRAARRERAAPTRAASLSMSMHPRVLEVTERIALRSSGTRRAYLDHIHAAALEGPKRSALSCSNLAHGFAACDLPTRRRSRARPRRTSPSSPPTTTCSRRISRSSASRR